MVTLKLLITFLIFFCTPLHVLTVPDHFSLQGEFPTWIKVCDRMMLETSNVKNIDVVVALDGTGDYRKVMDAVLSAPKRSNKHFVIHVKRGTYVENVIIGQDKWNLMIIGDGMDATVISGNLSSRQNNLTSYYTATFAVDGIGFIAKYISFKNTAGPENNQAVALRSSSDKSVFYRCGIFGYQDSLYAHSQRQFYRECRISGTVDFIFGYAAAVFQNCNILVKKGTPDQSNTITAQGGMHDSTKPFGFSFQFCKISADHDLLPVVKSTQTYLGRPWKDYSKTIFMETYISDVLSAQGWLAWNGTQYLDTLYYAEYKNDGPGANTRNRVKWSGYHVLKDSDQAINFTVAQLISGNQWLPSTNVPFTSGFGNKNTTL